MRWQLAIVFMGFTAAGCQKETALEAPASPINEVQRSAQESELAARTELDQATRQLETSLDELKTSVAGAASTEAKNQILTEQNPVPEFVDQMLKLAERYPEAPAAMDAVLAAVARGKGVDRDRSMNYLLDHFADRVDLDRIASSFLEEIPSPQIEGWLRKIIASAKTDECKAKTLYQFVKYKDQITPFRIALANNPAIAQRISAEQLAYVNAPRTSEATAEMEKMLQSIIDDYGHVNYRGQSFKEIAAAELFELQHLQIGQVAPDIEGQDLDGASFRLSDYRGKIVMLDFWGHWCGPCRAMYANEQQLTQELADKPFALIGLNSDRNLEFARQAVRDENLTWRHFWNGPQGTQGPISRKWNVEAWPTVYLIDENGVIRYREILGSDLENGLQILLAKFERNTP